MGLISSSMSRHGLVCLDRLVQLSAGARVPCASVVIPSEPEAARWLVTCPLLIRQMDSEHVTSQRHSTGVSKPLVDHCEATHVAEPVDRYPPLIKSANRPPPDDLTRDILAHEARCRNGQRRRRDHQHADDISHRQAVHYRCAIVVEG